MTCVAPDSADLMVRLFSKQCWKVTLSHYVLPWKVVSVRNKAENTAIVNSKSVKASINVQFSVTTSPFMQNRIKTGKKNSTWMLKQNICCFCSQSALNNSSASEKFIHFDDLIIKSTNHFCTTLLSSMPFPYRKWFMPADPVMKSLFQLSSSVETDFACLWPESAALHINFIWILCKICT